MDLDRNTIIAFLLIGLVFLITLTPTYQKLVNPGGYEKAQMAKQQAADSLKATGKTKPAPKEVGTIPQLSPGMGEKIAAKDKSLSQSSDSLLTGLEETRIEIDTDLYWATLSTRGASLLEWVLKDYNGLNDKPVTMLPREAYGTLGIRFITDNGDTVSTFNWVFDSDYKRGEIIRVNSRKKISFYADMGNGRRIVKDFEFVNGRYDFNLSVRFENLENIVSEKKYFIEAPAGLVSTEKVLKEDAYYSKVAISASGQVEKKSKAKGIMESETGDIDWVAVRTKYFTMAVAPMASKGIAANVLGKEIASSRDRKAKWKKFAWSLEMPFLGGSRVEDSFLVYMGPIDDSILKQYELGFQNIMDMGWPIIKPFSAGVLWSFKKLHTVIPNYGIVIIIFSILIKLLLYPLTHKSFESMQRMKDLQPKLNELKEKYGKDPQRMQKETMALYKQEGVNPMGSCLPMLLQTPLLFALFRVFKSTIELRGQGFGLWITDLSLPDTVATLPFTIPFYGNALNILPLFMGITMFLQQKMTITDPKQKSMVYIMPIFLTFLFNSFPAGLNLYYSLFNVLSIIQQKYVSPVKVYHEEPEVVPRKRKLR